MKRVLFRILVLGLGALLLIAQTESLGTRFHRNGLVACSLCRDNCFDNRPDPSLTGS